MRNKVYYSVKENDQGEMCELHVSHIKQECLDFDSLSIGWDVERVSQAQIKKEIDLNVKIYGLLKA